MNVFSSYISNKVAFKKGSQHKKNCLRGFVCYQVRLNPVYPATETSQNIEILCVASEVSILSRKLITKGLIRLRICQANQRLFCFYATTSGLCSDVKKNLSSGFVNNKGASQPAQLPCNLLIGKYSKTCVKRPLKKDKQRS